MSGVPFHFQEITDDTRGASDDEMLSEVHTEPSPIADDLDLRNNYSDVDKSLRELPEYKDFDESNATSLPAYENAARMHTIKLSELPTTFSPITDDLRGTSKNRNTAESPKELLNYDQMGENKAISLPTYETATKLHTAMKGINYTL